MNPFHIHVVAGAYPNYCWGEGEAHPGLGTSVSQSDLCCYNVRLGIYFE